MANYNPRAVKKEIIDGWLAETWKAALLKSTFTYDNTADTVWGDVSADEVAGTNYTAGGTAITFNAWGVGSTGYTDTINGRIDAIDTQWLNVTLTGANAPQYIVVYETTGDKIRAIYDLGATYPVTAGTFTIQWSSSGLVKISSAA